MDVNHDFEDVKPESVDESDNPVKTNESDCISKNPPNETFKKPQLIIGPQRGKGLLKSQNKPCRVVNEICRSEVERDIKIRDAKSSDYDSEESKDIASQTQSNHSKPPLPLPYNEPDWGGLPTQEYKLEELKSGTIVRTIDLTKRSFSVFGRLEHCDIPMLHPTVSRYHAALQYRVTGDDENEPGFYICDLGSSLGTFLNKQKLKPKTFVRVKVGYVLKIGCSTRMFILQGPADDEEPESELTVTELKQQRLDKLAALEEEKARLEAEHEERIKREEERGIDWGMGEDADEETDLTENPYASTQNEELYLDDPKKTLRGWFEREGEELVYDVEEKGFGHYICRIELPVDSVGGSLVAEASVKGKKKEAVAQAALEACRLLDRQGLLRQANHESKKRAAKDWEAMDFYDSDEDNFLDRTGQIEKKRQQRMAHSGKLEKTVETYDTLVERYTAIVRELEQTENKLNTMLSLATQSDRGGEAEDDLDAYMNTLHQAPADKIEIKKMKDEVARLRAEEGSVRKLVNLTRPTELPKLEPAQKTSKEKKLELPHGMVGKMSNKKRSHQATELPLETTKQQPVGDTVEEFDEDEEQPPQDKNETKAEVVVKKKRSRTDTRNRSGKRHSLPPQQVDNEDFSTCTWTPPVGQTGDGRTSLNDKLGY